MKQAAKGAPIMVTAWGETKNLYDWSKDLRAKVPYQAIRNRLERAHPWKPERAISEPATDNPLRAYNIERAPRYEAFGESKTLSEWFEDPRCECSPQALRRRLYDGIPLEQALAKKKPAEYRKRGGKTYEAFGEKKTLAEWANDPRCRSSYMTLLKRGAKGLSMERAIMGLREGVLHEAFGETNTMRGWEKDPRCVVSRQVLDSRLKAGVPIEVALTRKEVKASEFSHRAPSVLESLAALDRALRSKAGDLAAKPTAFGESKSIRQWELDPRCVATRATIVKRMEAGVPMELAIGRATSVRAKDEAEAFGRTLRYDQWAVHSYCAVDRDTFFTRVRAGMDVETAMTQPAGLWPTLQVTRFAEDAAGAVAAAVEATSKRELKRAVEALQALVDYARDVAESIPDPRPRRKGSLSPRESSPAPAEDAWA